MNPHSAGTSKATSSSAPLATDAAEAPVWLMVMRAARTSWGTTSHARSTARERAAAAATRATRLAASAAGLLGSPRPGGTRSPRTPSAHFEGRTEGLQPKAYVEAFQRCMQP